ncbi:MAG TPA: hypothetical protein VJ801_05920 [Polyangia bacterium]|jgi:hypothetical protein|nr:hypothetical protein [Polyangia bacterium]
MSADSKVRDTETDTELFRQGLSFLHQARDMRGLDPSQVERIERRLRERKARSRRMALWPALAALALLLAAGATFAVAQRGLRSLPLIGGLFEPPSVPATGATKPEKRRRPAMRKSPAEDRSAAELAGLAPPLEPSAEPASNPPPVFVTMPAEKAELPAVPTPLVPPAHQAGARPLALRVPFTPREGTRPEEVPTPAPAVARQESPIVAESHSLASVIEPWHRTHNVGAALALLDAHEQRYPNGNMRLETRMLRVEIYLAKGRETEALAVLDSLALSGIPRARELQTVRGELRIKAGRCPEGKRDLGDVLEKGLADPLAKRAAQALHHCP